MKRAKTLGDTYKILRGRRYYYQARYYDKRSANALVRSIRKVGAGAQVVQNKTEFGSAYDVYATKKEP